MLGYRFQCSVCIGGIVSSRTSSTIVASTSLRNSTFGGSSLTLGSLVVLVLADVGSAVVFVVAYDNIVYISFSASKVF